MTILSGSSTRYRFGEQESEKPDKKTRRMTNLDPSQYYTLINDTLPVSDGGFKPGVIFGALEFRTMLEERCISIGSVVKRECQTFVVKLKYNPRNGTTKLVLEKVTPCEA